MRRASGLIAVLIFLVSGFVAAAPAYAVDQRAKKVCVYVSKTKSVICEAQQTGSKPVTSGTSPGASEGGRAAAEADPQEGECRFSIVEPQPDPGDPLWEGHDPSKGSLFQKECFVRKNQAGLVDGLGWAFSGYGYAPAGNAPEPLPAVDPAVLAQQAIKQMQIPTPNLHYGPSPNQVAVKVPIWLWVDDPGTLTLTVAAGTVVVTAKASVASTTWSMGDPSSNPDSGSTTIAPTFTCAGTGQPPLKQTYDRNITPPCGYTYISRSTPARTNGACTWPVRTTANWTVTWESNTGAGGTLTMQTETQTAIHVGEWRTVLVEANGGPIPASPANPDCRVG